MARTTRQRTPEWIANLDEERIPVPPYKAQELQDLSRTNLRRIAELWNIMVYKARDQELIDRIMRHDNNKLDYREGLSDSDDEPEINTRIRTKSKVRPKPKPKAKSKPRAKSKSVPMGNRKVQVKKLKLKEQNRQVKFGHRQVKVTFRDRDRRQRRRKRDKTLLLTKRSEHERERERDEAGAVDRDPFDTNAKAQDQDHAKAQRTPRSSELPSDWEDQLEPYESLSPLAPPIPHGALELDVDDFSGEDWSNHPQRLAALKGTHQPDGDPSPSNSPSPPPPHLMDSMPTPDLNDKDQTPPRSGNQSNQNKDAGQGNHNHGQGNGSNGQGSDGSNNQATGGGRGSSGGGDNGSGGGGDNGSSGSGGDDDNGSGGGGSRNYDDGRQQRQRREVTRQVVYRHSAEDYAEYAQNKEANKFTIKISGESDENLFDKIFEIQNWQTVTGATDDVVYKNLLQKGLKGEAKKKWLNHIRVIAPDQTKETLYAFLLDDFDWEHVLKAAYKKLKYMTQSHDVSIKRYWNEFKTASAEYTCLYQEVSKYKPEGLGLLTQPNSTEVYSWFVNSLNAEYQQEFVRLAHHMAVSMDINDISSVIASVERILNMPGVKKRRSKPPPKTRGGRKRINNRERSRSRSRSRERDRKKKCFHCGSTRHLKRDCPKKKPGDRGERKHRGKTRKDQRRRREDRGGGGDGARKGPKGGCYHCGGNHFARRCPKKRTTSNQQEEVRKCYNCNKPGHLARDCPEKDDSKSDGRKPHPSTKNKGKQVTFIEKGKDRPLDKQQLKKRKSINFISAPQPPSHPHIIIENGTNVDDMEWDNINRIRKLSLATPPSKRARLDP